MMIFVFILLASVGVVTLEDASKGNLIAQILALDDILSGTKSSLARQRAGGMNGAPGLAGSRLRRAEGGGGGGANPVFAAQLLQFNAHQLKGGVEGGGGGGANAVFAAQSLTFGGTQFGGQQFGGHQLGGVGGRVKRRASCCFISKCDHYF